MPKHTVEIRSDDVVDWANYTGHQMWDCIRISKSLYNVHRDRDREGFAVNRGNIQLTPEGQLGQANER